MHPVEHLIFFTSCVACTPCVRTHAPQLTHRPNDRCCLPLFYQLHPLHLLFPCLYARISPIAGHDGFDKPAGGSYVHFLHHSKFTGEILAIAD